MFYEFPEVTHVDQILEAIKGRDEFVVKRDEDNRYIVVNYAVNFEDTFPPVTDRRTALLRECRGVTFCMDTGRVLARKYHKFFNVNERPETQIHAVDFTQPHDVLEKLDGSMLTPFMVKGRIQWGTKMGLTDVAKPVEEFVREYDLAHPTQRYVDFATMCNMHELTPIFEWCSRKQRIVIDYPEDRLVLTAIRHRVTGEYHTYDQLAAIQKQWGFPLARSLPGNAENIRVFMDEAHDLEGAEGYIIRFRNGHMLKVKGLWYCQLHGTLDQLRFEKDVIRLVLDDKLDDAKPFLPPDLIACVDNFAHDLFGNIAKQGERLYWIAQAAYDNLNGSKKRFAMETVNGDPANKPYAPLLFSIWDRLEEGEAGAVAAVRAQVSNCTGSQGKVNAGRYLFGNVHWNSYIGKKVPTDD